MRAAWATKPRWLLAVCVLALAIDRAAGLGPHQVAVLVRSDSQESLRVANHYRLVRRVPAENFVYLPYAGSAAECTWAEFDADVRRPTLDHLARRGLAERVCVWITTPGFPYRVGEMSMSGAIHFGAEINPTKSTQLGPAGYTVGNAYYDRWIAADGLPDSRSRPLHMQLTGGSLDATLAMIDRSAVVDGTHPTGTVYLCEGIGPRANRRGSIPTAKRLLQSLGSPVVESAGGDLSGKNDVLGLFTGVVHFPIAANRFLPGALADHLTSFGGRLADGGGQMLCRDFLDAGCSATYGTVVEPFNYPQKFPSAMLHAYYAAGFTAVESYWLSVQWPQQGIFLGDPLTRPFGAGPQITIAEPQPNQEIGESWPLQVSIASKEPGGGVAITELWMDDKKIATLGQHRLPMEAALEVSVGERTIRRAATNNETLAELLLGLRTDLAAVDVDAMLGATSLFLLRRPTGEGAPALSAASNSPVLQAVATQNRFIPGVAKTTTTGWSFQGRTGGDDQIVLEIRERGVVVQRLRWAAPAGVAANDVVYKITEALRPRLRQGYDLVGVPQSTEKVNDGCWLGLQAVAEKSRYAPEARLLLKGSDDSSWIIKPREGWQPCVDQTKLSYDFGWIRFGAGPLLLDLRTQVKSTNLTEGLHRLRVIAYRGTETLASTVAEISIVRRTHPGRLKLVATQRELSLADPPRRIAEARLKDLPVSPIEYRVDERPLTDGSDAATTELIDPKRFGVGKHTLRARTRTAGPLAREIEADDEIVFTITP